MAKVYKDISITCGMGDYTTKISTSKVVVMTENDITRLLVSFPDIYNSYIKSIDIQYYEDEKISKVASYDLTYDDILHSYVFLIDRKFTYYSKIKIQFRARYVETGQVCVDPTILTLNFRPSIKRDDIDFIDANPSPSYSIILQTMIDQHAELVGSTRHQGHF